jgi:hypothetical protein
VKGTYPPAPSGTAGEAGAPKKQKSRKHSNMLGELLARFLVPLFRLVQVKIKYRRGSNF